MRLATIVDRFLYLLAAVEGAALAVFGLLPRLMGLRFPQILRLTQPT